jgi:transposase-like protein
LFADAARPGRHVNGDRWFVDETYVKVAGRWCYLYRAVDQYGQVIDVLMTEHRDTAAARQFFVPALRHGPTPVEVTTDKAPAYLPVLDELAPAALHVTPDGGAGLSICADGLLRFCISDRPVRPRLWIEHRSSTEGAYSRPEPDDSA